MSEKEPNIKIPVDLANPGQFFACCGLLELASRIDENALAWFDGSKYCMTTLAGDFLDKFFSCTVEVDTSYQSVDTADGEEEEAGDGDDPHRGRVFPMRLGPPFHLLLNWWTDGEAQGQKLKLWTAGQRVTDLLLGHHKKKKKKAKGKPDEIIRVYTRSTREHFANVVRKYPGDWLRKAVPIDSPAAFSFDSRLSRNNALDLGHFTHGTLASSPAIDVLCLVGFQRFRPKMIEVWNRNLYCTWVEPLNAVPRLLTDDGSFWVLISDEYADHFGLMLRETGLHRRQWLIWYETFGVNRTRGFTRSSRHLFWMVKDPRCFAFHEEAVTRPSDRQAKYQDRRAAPGGRTWDSVWGINPPIPRLVENANERMPGFPTQLPLSLLQAIVGCASDPGDLILDPFSGSGTTGEASLRLGRRFVGLEKSKTYAQQSRARLVGVSQELSE